MLFVHIPCQESTFIYYCTIPTFVLNVIQARNSILGMCAAGVQEASLC